MSDVLAISLDGLLRLRKISNFRGVVEIRSHLFPGTWTWCVYKSTPLDMAHDLFLNQARHHTDSTKFTTPIVQPGV